MSNNNIPKNANQTCVGIDSEQAGKSSSCQGCPNQKQCATGEHKKLLDPILEQITERMKNIKHIIMVLSGKGGVGKSSFSSQLAWNLSEKEYQVGVLDIDICGPSIPRMFGCEDEEIHRSNSGWSPIYVEENLGVMSVGFMLSNKKDAIIWKGPRKTGLIKQFLTDVDWSDLDYLIIDAPPGTSDEHISIVQYLKRSKVDGAVIVTTPQEVSLLDVRKEINFCNKVNLPIVGVVENMSGFVCPCCKTRSEIFAPITGGAEKMCQEEKIQFLGSIPLDPKLLQACEKGESLSKYKDSSSYKPLCEIVGKIVDGNEISLKKESNEKKIDG